MKLTDDELKDLMQIADATMPAPWYQCDTFEKTVNDKDGYAVCNTVLKEDAKYIAAANPDVVSLIATELLELRKHKEQLGNEYAIVTHYKQENERLRKSLKSVIESERRKTEALENAREGFALMAEGEGEDYRVYMEMARYHMNQCDAALSGKDAE